MWERGAFYLGNEESSDSQIGVDRLRNTVPVSRGTQSNCIPVPLPGRRLAAARGPLRVTWLRCTKQSSSRGARGAGAHGSSGGNSRRWLHPARHPPAPYPTSSRRGVDLTESCLIRVGEGYSSPGESVSLGRASPFGRPNETLNIWWVSVKPF